MKQTIILKTTPTIIQFPTLYYQYNRTHIKRLCNYEVPQLYYTSGDPLTPSFSVSFPFIRPNRRYTRIHTREREPGLGILLCKCIRRRRPSSRRRRHRRRSTNGFKTKWPKEASAIDWARCCGVATQVVTVAATAIAMHHLYL